MIPQQPSAHRAPALIFFASLVLAGCTVFGSPSGPTPTPVLTASPTTGPTATASSSAGSAVCDPAALAAKITAWDGAAGHRVATVVMGNTGPAACSVQALWQPQLVDGQSTILIDSPAPAASGLVTVPTGGSVTTMVQDGNYCGPTPAAPVTVAFVLPGSLGRVVAAPLSATDATGVPPCLGPAGSAGDIEMQLWSP